MSLKFQHRSDLAQFPAGWYWADRQQQRCRWDAGGEREEVGSLRLGRGHLPARGFAGFPLQSRVLGLLPAPKDGQGAPHPLPVAALPLHRPAGPIKGLNQ